MDIESSGSGYFTEPTSTTNPYVLLFTESFFFASSPWGLEVELISSALSLNSLHLFSLKFSAHNRDSWLQPPSPLFRIDSETTAAV